MMTTMNEISSASIEQALMPYISADKKDYFAHPKSNGYRSLHLIVSTPIFLHNEKRMMKVEVQLRTLAMDAWASLEHKIRYKKQACAEMR